MQKKDTIMYEGVDVKLHTGTRQTGMFSFMLQLLYSLVRSSEYKATNGRINSELVRTWTEVIIA